MASTDIRHLEAEWMEQYADLPERACLDNVGVEHLLSLASQGFKVVLVASDEKREGGRLYRITAPPMDLFNGKSLTFEILDDSATGSLWLASVREGGEKTRRGEAIFQAETCVYALTFITFLDVYATRMEISIAAIADWFEDRIRKTIAEQGLEATDSVAVNIRREGKQSEVGAASIKDIIAQEGTAAPEDTN